MFFREAMVIGLDTGFDEWDPEENFVFGLGKALVYSDMRTNGVKTHFVKIRVSH